MCGALGGQKIQLDPLELEVEVQMVVGYYVGSGSQTQVFWQSSSVLNLQAISAVQKTSYCGFLLAKGIVPLCENSKY